MSKKNLFNMFFFLTVLVLGLRLTAMDSEVLDLSLQIAEIQLEQKREAAYRNAVNAFFNRTTPPKPQPGGDIRITKSLKPQPGGEEILTALSYKEGNVGHAIYVPRICGIAGAPYVYGQNHPDGDEIKKRLLEAAVSQMPDCSEITVETPLLDKVLYGEKGFEVADEIKAAYEEGLKKVYGTKEVEAAREKGFCDFNTALRVRKTGKVPTIPMVYKREKTD